MDWLTAKYVNLLSARVRNFKQKGKGTVIFSCPLCGDSKEDPRKARAFIYEKKGDVWFHCHNGCGGMRFGTFLKRLDPRMSSEFWLERFKDRDGQENNDQWIQHQPVDPEKKPENPLWGLRLISELDESHVAKRYLVSRQIPPVWFDRLLIADDFRAVAHHLDPKLHRAKGPTEPRLVIPSWSPDGKRIVNYQCRSLADEGPRYIGITVNDKYPQVFNLERLDYTKKAYALEGPFDSMFIENSIAMLGGTIMAKLAQVGHKNITVVYDNESRNSSTVKNILRAAEAGYPVCVWPAWLDWKDINDMVMCGGFTPTAITEIINENTHTSPLTAKAALSQWNMS